MIAGTAIRHPPVIPARLPTIRKRRQSDCMTSWPRSGGKVAINAATPASAPASQALGIPIITNTTSCPKSPG